MKYTILEEQLEAYKQNPANIKYIKSPHPDIKRLIESEKLK
jgi:hypothetical protein